MSAKQAVTVLGATGSIGESTLDVLARHREVFEVFAVTANTQLDKLFSICVEHQPRYAVIANTQNAEQLQLLLDKEGLKTEVLAGVKGLVAVSEHKEVDAVMAAIVGAAGLLPTMAAAQAGKKVLLANKEALVMAGALFMQAVAESGATLLPIDSEHNAIFQCLPGGFSGGLAACGIEKILLTGSGGPFRQWPVEDLNSITPEQACAHPNWSMGRKISVDSATMMNKGLELIEACWLFDISPDDIEVVIHPQSVIHSMVQYADGSTLAQMGNPDMRTPIAYGLSWPKRMDAGVKPLDLFDVARLDFERSDEQRFPCLRLAKQAFNQGGTAAATLNAANEVAVEAFLQRQIPFTAISEINERVLNGAEVVNAATLEVVIAADQAARLSAQDLLVEFSL
ncbi:MAG: 1-deoxy-D-xylulose-5-phosphate reductoisomerase [Pseudomonadales bacterium]|nr:1-deoxy-D-xylulose-5-phosphate reductoisomerase [Pseudomonadales bacterium]